MSDGTKCQQQPAASGRERRASQRFAPSEVPWIDSIKTSVNEEAQLLDISRTGLLVDTRGPLQPGRKRIIWIAMTHAQIRTDVLVLRSVLTRIESNGKAIYRSALLFSEPVDLRLPESDDASAAAAVVESRIPVEEAPLPASSPLELGGPVESLWATETGSEVAVASRITENGCIVEACVQPALDQIASLSIFFSPARRLTLTGRVVELIGDRRCTFRFSNLTPHIQRALRVEIRCGTKPHATSLSLARAAMLDVPFEPLMDAAVADILQANHW